MMAAKTTELEKLESGFLKSIIVRTALAVAVAAPVLTGAGVAVEHFKTERAQQTAVKQADHLVPQAIFDIANLSEKVPEDLSVLKQAIQEKRIAMDEAVQSVGLVGQMLGWEKGPQQRSEAYEAHMQMVQAKIDEIVSEGWQPTNYVKNRSVDEKKADEAYIERAQTLYSRVTAPQFVLIRSR